MYDWKKSVNSALKDLVHSIIGVVAAAAVTYLADPVHWSALVSAVPVQYAIPAGLLVSAATAYLRNWLKNYNRP